MVVNRDNERRLNEVFRYIPILTSHNLAREIIISKLIVTSFWRRYLNLLSRTCLFGQEIITSGPFPGGGKQLRILLPRLS